MNLIESYQKSEERMAEKIAAQLRSAGGFESWGVFSDSTNQRTIRDQIRIAFLREQFDRPTTTYQGRAIVQTGVVAWTVIVETASADPYPQARVYGVVPHVRIALMGFDPLNAHPPGALYELQGDRDTTDPEVFAYKMTFESTVIITGGQNAI